MGSLSQLLSLYPVRTALDIRCRFGAAWVLDHGGSGAGVAPYHLVVRGGGRLEVGGQKDIRLEPGDIVLFPTGSPHRLYSEGGLEAPVPAREQDGGPLRLLYNEGDAPETGILCGQFEFSHGKANALLAALPDVVHIRTRERGDLVMLRSLLEMLRVETESERPGARAVISQLASALFALLMRAWMEQTASTPGLFALLAEPRLRSALQGMLAAPEHPWQLAELAAACNMSRATFARVFQKAANATPAEILTRTRMARAAVLLGEGRLQMGEVAERVGYQSEAAFNRVFKRYYGIAPGSYRRGIAAGLRVEPGKG